MDDSPKGVQHTTDGHERRDRGKHEPPSMPPTTRASHVHILPGQGQACRAADLARQASWPDVALLTIASALNRHLRDRPDAELVALGVSENDPLDAVPFAPAGLTVDRLVDK